VFDASGVAVSEVAVCGGAIGGGAVSGVAGREQLAVPSAVRAATVATHSRTVSWRIRKRDARLDATLSPGVSQCSRAEGAGWMKALTLQSSL
jgi:hypothetical protein